MQSLAGGAVLSRGTILSRCTVLRGVPSLAGGAKGVSLWPSGMVFWCGLLL